MQKVARDATRHDADSDSPYPAEKKLDEQERSVREEHPLAEQPATQESEFSGGGSKPGGKYVCENCGAELDLLGQGGWHFEGEIAWNAGGIYRCGHCGHELDEQYLVASYMEDDENGW